MDAQNVAPGPTTAADRPRTPLELLEASGVLAAAGRWQVIGVVVGLLLAIVVAGLAIREPGPVLGVIAATGLMYGLLLSRPVLFARFSEYVTVVGVVTASLVTTGGQSPFRLFLVFPFVWSAVTRDVRGIVAVWVVAAAGRSVLVFEGGVAAADVGQALLEVGLWSTVGLGIWALRDAVGRTLDDLNRSDAVHRALVDGHSSGVYVLDAEFKVAEVNDALLTLLGWSREEVIGRSVLKFVPPELHVDAAGFADQAMRGSPLPYESVALASNGERIPMLVTHARIAVEGKAQGLFGILQDLRGIHDERAERVAVERRFTRLAESSSDGMFVLRIARDAIVADYVNPALVEMFGFDPRRTPDGVDAVLRGFSDQGRRTLARRLVSDEPGTPFEIEYQPPGGEARWFELRDAWHEDASGNRIGRQGTVRDVTREHLERQALAEALEREQQASEELRRTQRMQTTFLQSLSHEIRTPLTSIQGMLATLQGRGNELSLADARSLVERADANARRLGDLLVDLLDIERLDRPAPLPDTIAVVDVAAVVGEAVQGLAGTARRVTLDLQPAAVLVDVETIERVTLALVGNAVRHAGNAAIRVHVRCAGRWARLTVEDDGPGIPEDLLPRLFDPFSQGAESLDDARPGAGIGLALARRLLEVHGGTIEAANRPEGGASFDARIPLAVGD